MKHRALRFISVWRPAGLLPGPWQPKTPSSRPWPSTGLRPASTPWGVSAIVTRSLTSSSIIRNPVFPPIFYADVNPGKAQMLTNLFLAEGDPRFEHVLGATEENDMIPWVMEFSRFNQEKRVVMEKCGRIDPEDIYDYIAEDGYATLVDMLQRSPEEVIQQIKDAGLRGRGGAGFPTGVKWELAAEEPRDTKFVICNADEGDPGAYMDRTILESNPHQVLEGIIACAYAVGAHKAIVYIRAEYPLAVRIVTAAIHQAQALGLVGRTSWAAPLTLRSKSFRDPGPLSAARKRP